MTKKLYDKLLIFSIIVLFIGVNFASVVNGNSQIRNKINIFNREIPSEVSSFLTQSNERVENIDTGEWFDSIQEAINDTDTEDTHTLVAHEGMYNESVVINKAITLRGQIKETAIINADSRYDAVIIDVENINPAYRVKLFNFIIQNSSQVGYTGINIYSNNADIHDNIIINYEYGISVQSDTHNINIYSNTLSNIKISGIEIYNAEENVIENNDIFDYLRSGILINKGVKNDIINNNINVDGKQKGLNGIRIVNSQETHIFQNIIKNNENGIFISDDSHNNKIYWNDISNNEQIGIKLCWESGGNSIYSNNIENNNACGIYLENCTDYNSIYHNNIAYNFNPDYGEIVNAFWNESNTNWLHNYWGTGEKTLKLIWGTINDRGVWRPWPDYEWCPSQVRYEIPCNINLTHNNDKS